MFRQLSLIGRSLQTFGECVQPANHKPLNQMQDEEDGEHVSCKGTIDYEASEELGLDRVTHDVQAYGLKTQKEHDTVKDRSQP